MHIALYARVSTTRQAENALSIPDQLRQMRIWAERNGHVIVKEYIEPGDTATDDKRPAFQDMINDATIRTDIVKSGSGSGIGSGSRSASSLYSGPFQAIIVHSLSRFFRDLVMGAMYEKKLMKAGVQLISITRQLQNDPAGEMQRHIIMMFDEYQSKETAKHVLRGMQENARQGYFNGSKAPFGYETVNAGQTGAHGRIKKKLAILESEARIVRMIFELYVNGIDSPRMGIKSIAKRLNAEGITIRGKQWQIQTIHQILSSSTYAGSHVFNQTDSKTGKTKDEGEWIKTSGAAIISQELFDKATKLRDAWSPLKCVPQREASPNMLMGLLKCGHCGCSMSVVTGKAGRYKYYKCNGRMRKGDAACPSKNFPLEKIDNLVLKAFTETVYTPQHMRAIIDDLRTSLAKNKDPKNQQKLKRLETELKETEAAQAKLFEAVEKGFLELDDQLRERARQHKETRQMLLTEIATLKRQHNTPLQILTPQKVEAVSKILIKRLSTPSSYTRAYLKATLKEIRITDEHLKLSGTNTSMAGLIANNGAITAETAVPMFIPSWCARRDSNSRPSV